jgi:biotin carboxylase
MSRTRAPGRETTAGTEVVIVAGFLLPLLKIAADFQPPKSMIFIEEPDVARRRGVAAKAEGSPVLKELIEYEYQRPGAADRFYLDHRDLAVAAVVPALEYAVPFAARLAERYGVAGATLGAAQLLRDKGLLRSVTAAAGVANPASEPVDGPDGVRDFVRRHPGPVIIKPANRQAAVGARIITDPVEIDRAWVEALDQDEGVWVPLRAIPLRMLVEEYVDGPEFSVEMLVQDGVPLFANVTGKVLFPGPRPIEVGHVVPADIPAELGADLIAATRRVVDAVGFGSGFLHCEWIVAAGVPYLVECAGRMPGDHIMELIRHGWPLDIVHRYLAAMKGADPRPVTATPRYGGAVWFLHAEAGVVDRIDGLDEARTVPGVSVVSCDVQVGDETHELRSSWDRVGVVMAFGLTPAQALESARGGAERIKITVTR